MKLFLSLALTTWLTSLGLIFAHNLPSWCNTPYVGHNYLVQPLCK